MSKALNTKFTIVGNEISSNILGMFLKYHSNLNQNKLNVDLYHIEKEKFNFKYKIFNTKRLSFNEIQELSNKKEKKNSNLNTNFDIKIYNKYLLEEFKIKLNNINNFYIIDDILLGEIDNFYRLNNNKQINQYIFDKMKIFENKKIIQYGNKSNLQRFNIKTSNNHNDNNNNNYNNNYNKEIFNKEKNINFFLAIKLKLFDYKIKRRKDISMKLIEKDLNLEEYLKQFNISKEVNEYLKGFYKCKKNKIKK
jgi:hypothetical protein